MKKKIRKIFQNKYVKLALILFIAGFFLGYSMRFLDFVKSPIFGSIGVIYPVHQEATYKSFAVGEVAYYGYSRGEIIGRSPIDLLYVMRNNILSAVLLVGMGVLAALPTGIFTFLVGLSVGASIPETLEFMSMAIGLKTILSAVFYVLAVVMAASVGIEIGKGVIDLSRGKKFRVDKEIYDRILIAAGLVIFNILLQYILLVM